MGHCSIDVFLGMNFLDKTLTIEKKIAKSIDNDTQRLNRN